MVEASFGYEDFIVRMATGLLVGALIGIERERAQLVGKSEKSGSIPGFRSMGFMGLYGSATGYVSSYTASQYGVVFAALIAGLGAATITLLTLLFAYTRMIRLRAMGFTTYVVILLTFVAGLMSGMGLILEGVAVGVIGGLLLASKYPVVRMTRSVSYSELIALMEVAALILVLGPAVYYAGGYIPFIDVFQVYIFFTAIVAVSFTSYIASRIWGVRGFVTSIILGSIVNSEAVVASIASRRDIDRGVVFQAVVAALSVMQLRIAGLGLLALLVGGGFPQGEVVLHFRDNILPWLILLALMTIASIVAWASTLALEKVENKGVIPGTPLQWGVAVRGAVAFLLLTLLFDAASRALSGYTGNIAFLTLSIIGGFISANATLLSLAGLLTRLGADTFTVGILGIALGATFNKILYTRAVGAPPETVKEITKATALMSLLPVFFLILFWLLLQTPTG
ncbi:conserved hypothetical protein [Aeropyrum pernix K1]|uniref:Uncharacterized protein n=1 Tax=Aeropyrum pernix (strain ATCC 700893 / DSM 11879 / JCM 9820 / NBRC 100138 / K1) TaxID=272557 RepID=Q9YC78_AERPE|nr:MgtC/SapB family protein [Aeropyrum pernix]BAA80370.1 conserved hypothetical protein [Aeropyrum pernix K1]